MNPGAGEGLIARWRWVLAGAAVWWVLGLNLFVYQATAAGLFFMLLQESRRLSRGLIIPPTAVCLFLLSVVYLFSMAIHSGSSELSRVVAAGYNLSFWIMGGMIVMVLANAFKVEDIAEVLRVFRWLAIISGILAVGILGAWYSGSHEIILKTPLHFLTRYVGNTVLVESTLTLKPLLFDWFASLTRPRFNVFSPYPTAAGGILMILLMMLIVQAQILRRMKHPAFWLLAGVTFLGLVMTLSRMSMMGLLIALGSVYLIQKRNFGIWMFASVLLLIAAAPLLMRVMEIVLSLREGSNVSRFELYRYSLQQLEGSDWIIGLGMKPRENQFLFPLGSHSTYISLTFKTGLVGLFIFLVFQITLFTRWYSLKALAMRRREIYFFWRGLGLVFIAMALWVVTEDIDAPQLLAFIYFSFVGLFEGLYKELRKVSL